MAQIKRCLDCGAETPIIRRFIGFFGLQETHTIYCRNCIGVHAWKVGLTPSELLAELDEAVRRVEEGRRQYEERSRKRRSRHPDTPGSPPPSSPSP